MRAEADGRTVRIVLSKANLLALLHKLEMGDSARTIFRETESGWLVVVTSESDDEHYAGRERGEMHPLTEAFMTRRQ